jgi:prepilin signal peptidase PulO-like enzyme (type II secretory pathway)
VQYPLIELTVAVIWVGLALWHGPGLEAVRGAVFLTALLGIAIIDGRHYIIPDQLSLGGGAAGLALAAWPAGFSLTTAAIGAGVGYVLMWGVKVGGEALFRKPALGVGDIHMVAMIGAFTGVWGVLLTVMLGSLFGLLIGVPVARLKGTLESRGTYLPLGTFLAMGAAVTYIWGDAILQWYLTLAFS